MTVVNVGGVECPILTVSRDVAVVSVTNWIVTLVVANPADLLRHVACTNSGPDDGSRRLRHGANTASRFDETGAWILASPWRAVVDTFVRTTEVVGWASMASQWRYVEGQRDRLVSVLVPHLCRQMPGWGRLSDDRRVGLAGDLDRLVRGFLDADHRAEVAAEAAVVLDRRPGTAIVPLALINGDQPIDPNAVEASDQMAGESAAAAVDYWWQSVFTMWWKGFW